MRHRACAPLRKRTKCEIFTANSSAGSGNIGLSLTRHSCTEGGTHEIRLRSVVNVLLRSTARLRAPAAAASVVCAASICPAFAQVTETVLYSFLGGSDGLAPFAPVIADMSQNEGALRALYGTTTSGGAFNAPNCVIFGGCGVVFKLTPTEYGQTPWTETVLASFTGGITGASPFGGLFARKEGISQTTSFYGTTGFDGTTGFGGFGTVFKVTGQTLTTIYSFTGGSDGSEPGAGLIADEAAGAARALYGTAEAGGSNNCGTVYRLMPPKDGNTAWTETTLWAFSGGSDGCSPNAPLIADNRGALYSTTELGGAVSVPSCVSANGTFGCGVVFRLTGTGFVPRDRDE